MRLLFIMVKEKVNCEMSIVATFLWIKSPKLSICTMIHDNQTVELLLKPMRQDLPSGYFPFRKAVKKIIGDFFQEIVQLHKARETQIIIEYKIIFNATVYPYYVVPSKESKFVYKTFMKGLKKLTKRNEFISVKPQLRSKLTGKSLKYFKRELRALYLVSRKRNTGFEYLLWMVALHATESTYKKLLAQMRNKLFDSAWHKEVSAKGMI